MASWKKIFFLTLAIVPIMGVLSLMVLSTFFRNPEKRVEYHAPNSVATPIVAKQPIQELRQKIILLFHPQSRLLPQPTGAELQRQADEELAQANMRNLECMNVSYLDTKKVADCQKLAEENFAAALSPQPPQTVTSSQFRFMVEDANDLVGSLNDPYFPMIQSQIFVYESRGFKDTDALLKQYLAQKSEERKNDLWLTEDRFTSSDNSMGAFQRTIPNALRKFQLTSEYTYKGAPVLGTSDYIIHFRSLDSETTQIELIPLLPRILAGVRFEDGCHAAYCPRFDYDLRPVDRYDAERIELSDYIKTHVQ